MKIAVFMPNWIGDTVMATPALRAVRRKYPDAEIVAILRPHVTDVLAGLDLIDRDLLHDPRGKSVKNYGWQFVSRMQREQFDLALLFPNSLRSGWLAWLSGAKRRVGFNRNCRGRLLTDRIVPKPKSEPHPVIDEYLRLAEHLGCTETSRNMELATVPEDDLKWNRFWNRQDSRLQSKGIITLNPGGAFGSAKHWPSESFGLLARRLALELDKTVLVLCGPAERDEARSIVRIANHPSVLSLADVTLSIGLTKVAVKQSELLISTDSGPRHFASPFGVPVVTLFGPTHIAWSETYYPKEIPMQIDVDCGPCQKRICPLGHHRCMTDLSADRVFSAAVSLLDRYASAPPIAS